MFSSSLLFGDFCENTPTDADFALVEDWKKTEQKYSFDLWDMLRYWADAVVLYPDVLSKEVGTSFSAEKLTFVHAWTRSILSSVPKH